MCTETLSDLITALHIACSFFHILFCLWRVMHYSLSPPSLYNYSCFSLFCFFSSFSIDTSFTSSSIQTPIQCSSWASSITQLTSYFLVQPVSVSFLHIPAHSTRKYLLTWTFSCKVVFLLPSVSKISLIGSRSEKLGLCREKPWCSLYSKQHVRSKRPHIRSHTVIPTLACNVTVLASLLLH